MTKIEELREYLETAGPCGMLPLLQEAWPEIGGSDQEAMATHKLARLEDPAWDAPVLSFTMERHGGTALGSSRAELQRWYVNLDSREAEVGPAGVRQLRDQNPRLDVRPLAREVAAAINAMTDDPRVKWLEVGGRKVAQPVLSRIIPNDLSVPKQTAQGRRGRFRHALQEELAALGWESIQPGRYARSAP